MLFVVAKQWVRFGHGEISARRISNPQRRYHSEMRRHRRRLDRHHRGQSSLHSVHLLSQQDRSDFYRGVGHHLQDSSYYSHFGSSQVEFRRFAREDLDLFEAHSNVGYNHINAIKILKYYNKFVISQATLNRKDNFQITRHRSFCLKSNEQLRTSVIRSIVS